MKKSTIAIILLLHLLLSSYVIFGVQREHWFDVSFSLETTHKLNSEGLGSINFQQYDVHPPTYYYILALWQRLPNPFSEYHWAQLLSVVFGSVFLLFATLFTARIAGRSSAAFVGAFLATASTYLHFSTEVRMYALVLALSAIGFYGVVAGGKWRIATILAIFLLPNVHYLAAIASIGIIFMHLVAQEANNRSEFLKSLSAFCISLIIGIAFALTFALPQAARGDGTWFSSPSIISIPSSWFFSMFTLDDMFITSAFAWSVFLVFCIGCAFLFTTAVRILHSKLKLSREKRIWLVCVFTALVPAAYIIFIIFAIKLSVGGGFARLYHHRFFLSITWLFAAGYLVWLYDIVTKRTKRIKQLLITLIFLICIALLFQYFASAHHELENIMDATPCNEPAFDNAFDSALPLLIGHESPFSALPYEVYAREHNCNWINFISTNISVAMSRSAGFDIVNPDNVYWNLTLPPEPFYYVQSSEKSFPIQNRTSEIIAEDEGIWLLSVK